MRKLVKTVAVALSASILFSTTAFAKPLGSSDWETVVNTGNGFRYLFCKQSWGNMWQGGYNWVDTDNNGIFELRYFLSGYDKDGNYDENREGYMYQPGMELSETEQKELENKNGIYGDLKDGQAFDMQGQPIKVYKNGQPLEGGGYKYTFRNISFKDPENKLGKMRVEDVAGNMPTYYQESVYEAEKTLGEAYYQTWDYMSKLVGISLESNWSLHSEWESESVIDRWTATWAYNGDYTKYKDSNGITWYVYYHSTSPNALRIKGYDFDHPVKMETFNNKVYDNLNKDYKWTGSIDISNASSVGIDKDYVIANIEYIANPQ